MPVLYRKLIIMWNSFFLKSTTNKGFTLHQLYFTYCLAVLTMLWILQYRLSNHKVIHKYQASQSFNFLRRSNNVVSYANCPIALPHGKLTYGHADKIEKYSTRPVVCVVGVGTFDYRQRNFGFDFSSNRLLFLQMFGFETNQ